MTIDLERYNLSKDFIQKSILRDDGYKLIEKVSFIAVATNVPIIVCYFYAGEVLGWTKEILDAIDFLIIFYRYDSMVGMPVGFPKELAF